MLNRRALMTGLAGAALVTAGGGAFAKRARKARPFFAGNKVKIGLQLYTLGEDPGKDLDGTLAKVAAIGYRDLELPSLFGKTAAELKAAADKHGVAYSAIHLAAMAGMAPDGGLSMMSETQRIVDDLGVLGIKNAVMPILLIPDTFRNAKGTSFQEKIANALAEAGTDGFKKTADLLNEKAAALKPHGIAMGYHNHNVEFAPIGNTTGWEVLAKAVDPSLVKFEVDLGWITAAGLDPVKFLGDHKGRVRWVHVKDVQATTKTNYALQMDPTEVGSGKQNWAKILPAARAAGVEHFYVEQEPPFAMERIDAAAKSFAYLAALKI